MSEQYTSSNSQCMSGDIRALAKDFLKAKQGFVATGKSARNDHQKYSYARLEDIYNAVEFSLIDNNIIIWHFCSINDAAQEELHTRLVHVESGQWIQDSRLLQTEKPGNQGKGIANTYMRKVAVLSLCSIAPEEDDDGASEQRHIERRPEGPPITEESINDIKRMLKEAPNGNKMYAVLLQTYAIRDLSELKEAQAVGARGFIVKNTEKK